ncbi:MAG: hypothetical protein KC917_11245 [Candidatus Omnitrophica bacterium]|nr:hypothetical protein [Candidatus Omnitrophota bacterium]
MGWFIHGFHLLAVVIAVGGTFCLRFVVCPRIGEGEAANETRNAILRKWRPIVWAMIILITITGLANVHMAFLRVGTSFWYWVAFLVKFFLAMILFGIALMLTLPIESLSKVQENRDRWMRHIVEIGTIILFISAFLRYFKVEDLTG